MQRIFLRPAYDEFLQVVVEVFLVKRRRIDRVKELFELLQLDFDRVFAGSRRQRRRRRFRNGHGALTSGHFLSNGIFSWGGGKASSSSMKSRFVSFKSNAARFSRT